MKLKVELSDVFKCSIDKAFETPILGDATKFLNGYLFQPPVVGFEDDKTWGEIGGLRYPITNGNLFIRRGRIFTDKIIERNHNKDWKWMIYDFKVPMIWFAEKAIGEWHVYLEKENLVTVKYSYTFYSKSWILHLLTIPFVVIQWKGMMKKALRGIKEQAESNVR
jgi:hypothetical protein